MSKKRERMQNSAETAFLIRCWSAPDGTPRYMLETISDDQKRRLFQQLPEMTAHLSVLLELALLQPKQAKQAKD